MTGNPLDHLKIFLKEDPDDDPEQSSRDEEEFHLASLTLEEGAHMGRYLLGRVIGSGAMGVVYEATDPKLGRKVALKILKEVDHQGIPLKRFLREAQTAAQISHPSIIAIHEVGSVKESETGTLVHYIAMDHVEGATFKEVMPELSREEGLLVLETVAKAVGHAHAKGIVHRDLKPENILITTEGTPVVSDFGLAIWEGSGTRLTQTGVSLGTPYYMAPEQVTGDLEKIDPAIDVWALGVMIFEMATGEKPFQLNRDITLFRQIVGREAIRPRALDRSIDRSLETIILTSLQHDPRRRYQDAGLLADDLACRREGRPIRARLGLRYRLLPARIRRHPLAWSSVVLLGLGALVAVLLVVFLLDRAAQRIESRRRIHKVERYYSLGSFDEARWEVDQALAATPGYRRVRYWKTRLDLRQVLIHRPMPHAGNVDGALQILPHWPESKEAGFDRMHVEADLADLRWDSPFLEGAVALWSGRLEEAMDRFHEVDMSTTWAWETEVLTACCLLRQGKLTQARELMHPYLVLEDPLVHRVWHLLSTASGIDASNRGDPFAPWFESAVEAAVRIEKIGLLQCGRLSRARTLIAWGSAELDHGGLPSGITDPGFCGILDDVENDEAMTVQAEALLVLACYEIGQIGSDPRQRKSFETILETLSAVLKGDPRYWPARLARARTKLSLSRFTGEDRERRSLLESASRDVAQVLERFPGSPEPLSLAIQIRSLLE